MSRIDFYTKVHKGLRAVLFDMSTQAATVDYADARASAAFALQVAEIFERLSSHAAHEERFVHPLIRSRLGHAPFDSAHRDLEDAQQALCGRLTWLDKAPYEQRAELGLAFYRALNIFIADYLQHLDEEEALMPQLWARCNDAELGEVMVRFAASRPLGAALADLGWMLPALNAAERAELLHGMSSALERSAHAGRSPGPSTHRRS
jgi:hypothetical protein